MAPVAPPTNVQRFVEFHLGRMFWDRWVREVLEAWNMVPHARLTSWFRSPALNAFVGGHPRSQHLLGLAADFAIPGVGARHQGNPDAERLASAFRARGFVAVLESDHLHVQTFRAG